MQHSDHLSPLNLVPIETLKPTPQAYRPSPVNFEWDHQFFKRLLCSRLFLNL